MVSITGKKRCICRYRRFSSREHGSFRIGKADPSRDNRSLFPHDETSLTPRLRGVEGLVRVREKLFELHREGKEKVERNRNERRYEKRKEELQGDPALFRRDDRNGREIARDENDQRDDLYPVIEEDLFVLSMTVKRYLRKFLPVGY